MDNLKILERRITKLEERIQRQKIGLEVETSKKILFVLKKKYAELAKNNTVLIAEATTSSLHSTLSEDELIERLGASYWIFGSSYEEEFSFKKYRIDFLRILPNNDSDSCVMRVQVNVFENDKPFATENAIIEFWKGFKNSTEVDDLGFSCNQNTKYNNFHWFDRISYTLAKTWNQYFKDVPLLEARNSGLLTTRR